MDIEIHCKDHRVSAENDISVVTLFAVDLSQLIGQINAVEVLEALRANDQYDEIVKFVEDEKSEGKYELPGFSDTMQQVEGLGR